MAALALTGVVGFRATYLVPDAGAGVQQEHSQFVREDGRWLFLDSVG
ncbi:MAG: hypothetical protein LCH96_02290 [Actinobacteria bacterium]|nr:hypothetical protein [Actinomycetota bacterium]